LSEAHALVRRAIEEKKPLEATYKGHRRRLCPHLLGTRRGRSRALFFQFGGGSNRGLPPGGDWRCLEIDGLSEVSIGTGPWRTKAHSQPQHCVDEVELEVEG
jgi:hypothetical protein